MEAVWKWLKMSIFVPPEELIVLLIRMDLPPSKDPDENPGALRGSFHGHSQEALWLKTV
jgi:hypothetical protein